MDIFGHFDLRIWDAGRIVYALAALVITVVAGALSGPLAGNANPLVWIGIDKIFGRPGERLDRLKRPRADLIARGVFLTLLAILLALSFLKPLKYFTFYSSLYGFPEIAALCLLMTSGSVFRLLFRLYKALEGREKAPGAFYALSRTTRLDLSAADNFAITRAGMGLAARAFDKGMVAPVFWYVAGGAPLALIYAALAGLAWRFGKNGFTKGFGAAPLFLERIMGFIPGLLAATLIALAAAFTPTAGIFRGFSGIVGLGGGRARYAEGWAPVSSLAWALNVSLGGPGVDLQGSAMKCAWAGPSGATAQLDYRHLKRAGYIVMMAHVLFVTGLLGLYLWHGKSS